MTENEIKLIEMVRNQPNKVEALIKAIEIILLIIRQSSESA